jgi:hypothetical protein
VAVHLTDTDRLVIHETLEEIESTPPPADPGPIGCPIALLGVGALVGLPFIGRMLDVPRTVVVVVVVGGAAALVIGLILSMTSGGFVRGASIAAVEAAVRQLEDGDNEREVLLRAATLLLAHAYVSHGPTMTSSFERHEVGPRIERAMPLVLAVEAHLIEIEQLYPVFTADDSEEVGEGGEGEEG